jgi:prophage regulatory protein
MDHPTFPTIARRPRTLELTGFSSTGLDREMDRGLFPEPIKLSPDPTCRAVGWIESEIAAVNAAKIAGANEDELRRLVADLVAARVRKEAA